MPASVSSLYSRRSFLRLGALSLAAGPQLLKASTPERSLSFYNLHTLERLTVVYRSEGGYLAESRGPIHRLLRDHRTGTIHGIDRRLLDLLCPVRSERATAEAFDITAGYRSPAT